MRPAAWYSAAVTAAILPLIYWVTWRVLTGPFSPEVQSVVVGAVVGSGLGAVTGFWLGSSAGSQRKDETRAP
jgi:membrane protein YqaA with SNARE-associated domain